MNLDPEYLVNMKDLGFGGLTVAFWTVAGSNFWREWISSDEF